MVNVIINKLLFLKPNERDPNPLLAATGKYILFFPVVTFMVIYIAKALIQEVN